MARLRELVPAMRATGPLRFVHNVWREIGADNLFTLASALAYAWLFAIFPFLIFLLTLVAYVPNRYKVNARDHLEEAVNRIMAKGAADTIVSNLERVMKEPKTGLLSLGAVLTLWAASGGVAMTMSALDAAYDAPTVRPFYKQRPIAILLTFVLTALIVLVFVLLPVGTAVMRWIAIHTNVPTAVIWAINFVRYGMALLLMLGVLATLYKFGTSVPQRFVFISPGAVFTVIVWFVLGSTFRFYVDKFGHYDKTYGTVGGVTIILLFFYLDALVMLIGAEINSEVDGAMNRLASRSVAPESLDMPLATPVPHDSGGNRAL
jgi:membrane protein